MRSENKGNCKTELKFHCTVFFVIQLSYSSRQLFVAGKGNYPKLLSVSPCGETGLEARMDMGQGWGDLVNEWSLCDPARELLILHSPDPTLMLEKPCHSWSGADCCTRKHDRGLLPWWHSFCLGYHSFQFILILWDYCRKLGGEYSWQQASKSYSNGTRSWLHL